MTINHKVFRVPALEIRQTEKRFLYVFGIDGKLLTSFAAVSRIHRTDDLKIEGYQRPEVLSHIKSIQKYLETEDPILPNALVVAFDGRVEFVCDEEGVSGLGYVRSGHLEIPVTDGPEWARPGWIVDGQQRTAAIRQARLDSFPVCAVGFIARDEEDQRAQFILVNSTKPLPKGLIHELLPETVAPLPAALQQKRLPARLINRLNHDPASPFCGMIRTTTNPDGTVKDNSVLRMIANSLSDGVLYRFREPQTEEGDLESMFAVVAAFWTSVRNVWPVDWGLPPRKSRLLHGVGVLSLGYVMDAIADRNWSEVPRDPSLFQPSLEKLAPQCRWSSGYWQFGPHNQRKWNELQNTSKDIQLLANFLLATLRV